VARHEEKVTASITWRPSSVPSRFDGAIRRRSSASGKRQKHDEGRPVRGETYAGRLRMRVVPNRSRLALTSFVLDSVAKDTMIVTDGWPGYEPLKRLGYEHESVVLGGDPELTEATLPADPPGLLQPEGMAPRYPPRRPSPAPPGVPERVRVPLQPALLPDGDVQQRPRDCGHIERADVPVALRREVAAPQPVEVLGVNPITMVRS